MVANAVEQPKEDGAEGDRLLLFGKEDNVTLTSPAALNS